MEQAKKQARIWKIVNIVFLIMPVITCIVRFHFLPLPALAIQAIFIIIVWKFIAELETAITRNAVAVEVQPNFYGV